MDFKSRLDYVRAVGLKAFDVAKPMSRLDSALQWVLAFAAKQGGAYRNVYVPIDVKTGQLPHSEPGWKKITVGQGEGAANVWTSPNVWLIMMRHFTHKICPRGPLPTPEAACRTVYEAVPVLIVDYSVPLGYMYAGTERPPDRPLDAQLTDWQNGVELARVHLPNDSVTEEELEKFEAEAGVKIPRGWYWVAYEASLLLPPGDLLDAERALITVTLRVECKKYLFGAIKRCPSDSEIVSKAIAYVQRMLSPLGFTIDTSRTYTVDGRTLRGPAIIKKANGEATVAVPVVRAGSLGPEVVVFYALVLLIAALIAYAVVIYVKDVAVTYARAAEKRAETFAQYVSLVSAICQADPDSPACANLTKNVSAVAAASKAGSPSHKTGGLLKDAETLAKIGIGAILAYAVYKAVSGYKEGRWRL